LSACRPGLVRPPPILALNQYKIANPTILARIPEPELLQLLRGYGYDPRVVSGHDPTTVHQDLAATMDACLERIQQIHRAARVGDTTAPDRPAWPMIVLRTPKGWTCPPVVDGLQVEGTFRAHQVPLPAARTDDRHRHVLEEWLRSYRPDELFDETGRPVRELLNAVPERRRRMSANPVAAGGAVLKDLRLPDWRDYGVAVLRGRRSMKRPACSVAGCAT
jgi:xylulose-5-phosphate/fructose-6-phosphate phosphoketolase